jgi:hypothetical protein
VKPADPTGWLDIARRVALAAVMLCLTGASGAATSFHFEGAQEPSFRTSSSELVVLPVVVTDNKGRYVSDLASERFSVFDNGRRVPIELTPAAACGRS